MQGTQAAPIAPPPPVAAQIGAEQVSLAGQASPAEIYQALRAQRNELRSQLENLGNSRLTVARRLRDGGMAEGPDRVGLEKRIVDYDARIGDVQQQLAEADAALAKAAAVPGATVPPPPFRNGPPEEAYVLGALFMVVVLLPISIAFARRIWRRSAAAVSALPRELMDRMTRIEDAVETVALEVERIGEGQRFVTQLLVETSGPRSLGAGGMEPVEVRQAERLHERR